MTKGVSISSLKFSGGWAKITYCPHPFMRPMEARWVRDGTGQIWDLELDNNLCIIV